MVKEIQLDGKNIYQCEECGLKYPDKDITERCEAWCKEHKSCNLEITKQAIKNGSGS
jgi:hypothetical protein